MQQPSTDPRTPFIIGIVVLGAVLLGGIVWAIVSSPAAPTGAQTDPNLAFHDANDPTLGPKDAKVTLRIFGDLECPACKAAEPGVTHVRTAYADSVKIVWNDFPLPPTVHPKARQAAEAARCAEEQGKFWEMHDLMYQTQSVWAGSSNVATDFTRFATQLGLDEGGFRSCYEQQRGDAKISDDMEEGRANNVDATPTFFVNNTRYVGVISPDQWDAILKPLLTATAASSKSPSAPAMSSSSTQ